MKKRKTTPRKRECAICGNVSGGTLHDFGTVLRALGHPRWEHGWAHRQCVVRWQAWAELHPEERGPRGL